MSDADLQAFERAYAERSGVTVAKLHEAGRFGVPCDCEEPGCEGYAMAHASDHCTECRLMRFNPYR